MSNDQWQFRELDSSLFKAFFHAARELNFTRAAQKAALTQSGVSQKISKLESQIGHPLFLRINKSVSLTETGQKLLDFIERQQDEMERLFEELGNGTKTVRGPVRYGMPHTCLFTPHFPLLLQARRAFPEVTLKVELCPNEAVISQIIERKLDFGFITKTSANPAIEHLPFAVEEYVLAGPPGSRSAKFGADEIKDFPFVNYPGMRNLFEIWKAGHFPSKRALNFESLKLAGEINSLHAAVTMLAHGVGWAVVPMHVVDAELKSGRIQICPGTQQKHIRSEIHIVHLTGVQLPARVKAVIQVFEDMKK